MSNHPAAAAIAMVAVALSVAACGPPPDSAATSPSTTSTEARASLDVALGECGRAQGAVANALQGSDTDAAAGVLARARGSCRDAAERLRHDAPPGIDGHAAGAALDQMASGIGEIETGLALLDSAPGRARLHARKGMELYMAGTAALKAATPD